MNREKILVIGAGLAVGILSVLLVHLGNPANMGFCIACFLRDIAGGLGLHGAEVVQYLRPEIMGLVLGSFIVAVFFREYKSTGGSAPVIRFFLGVVMMVGALIFLGCPLRMLLRLAGGDLNALVALPGYVLGIWIGTLFLKKGFTLGRSYLQGKTEGVASPLLSIFLLILLLTAPAFIIFSESGPGSQYAFWGVALGAGLLVGVLAQRSRICTMGGIRDLILFKDTHLFSGLLALFLVTLAGKLIMGYFDAGFLEQPVAHTDGLWNFLGMTAVGWGAVLAGGCPLRQLILSGEGSSDALITVLGLVAGAAIAHNFGLASSPAGATIHGKVALGIIFLLLLLIGVFNSQIGIPAGSSSQSSSHSG